MVRKLARLTTSSVIFPGQALGNNSFNVMESMLVRTGEQEEMSCLKIKIISKVKSRGLSWFCLFVFYASVCSIHLKCVVTMNIIVALTFILLNCICGSWRPTCPSIERCLRFTVSRLLVQDENSDIRRRRHKRVMNCTTSDWIWIFQVVWLCMKRTVCWRTWAAAPGDSHQ